MAAERNKVLARLSALGKGTLVFLAVLLSVLPVLFVNNAVAWIPSLAVVLLLLLDAVYLAVVGRSLEFDEGNLGSTCVRGSSAGLTVRFSNKSLLPLPRLEVTLYITDLFGGYASERVATTVLLPKETRDFAFDARFRHLGTYYAGVSRVVIHDLIGLWSRTVENGRRHRVDVSPRLFDMARMELSEESLRESLKRFKPVVDDNMDYTGVRDYAYGDPMKSVHWKLSSRMPGYELYTRIFEVYGNPGLDTIVDPFAPDYDEEDLMSIFDGLVESSLSLNEYARSSGMDIQLSYLGKDREPCSTHSIKAGLDSVVSGMMKVGRASEDPSPRDPIDLLLQEGRSNHGMKNMALATSRLDQDIVSALVELKLRRRNPILMLVVPKSLEGDARKEFLKPLRRLESSQIPCYVVESSEVATEVVS